MTVAEKTMSSSSSFIHHHLNYFLPAVFTITDWLFIILAESCAYSLRNCIMGSQYFHIAWANFYLVFPLSFILFFRHAQVYQRRMAFWKMLQRMFDACTYAIIFIIFFMYATHIAASTSRLFVGLFWILSFIFAAISRYVMTWVLEWAGVGRIPVLLVGGGKTARLLLRGLREDIGMAFHIVGYVDDGGPQKENVGDLPYLGTFHDIPEIIQQTEVQDVFIAAPGLPPAKLDQLMHRIQPLVRNLSFVPDLIGLPLNGVVVENVYQERVPLMSLQNNLARPYNRMVKRIFDLVVTTLGTICISPILLLLAILVKLDSPGPVFFAHKRIGKDGKEFPCLKFRSMCVDADVKLKEYLAANLEAKKEWDAEFKLKDDPRVTRMGRILRRTSLDELPQLFNVLRGEMSLVGPRPIVKAEIPKYGDYIHDFYMVHPGITGMWQVNGRSDTTYEERVQMDSWYVRNWSVWLDIMLLWKTVGVVLSHKGAY